MLRYKGASLVAQMVKNLPVMQETQVQSRGWEDPLEKGMATHSSVLAWRIPWTEEPGRYSPWGCKESDMNEPLTQPHKCCGILVFWKKTRPTHLSTSGLLRTFNVLMRFFFFLRGVRALTPFLHPAFYRCLTTRGVKDLAFQETLGGS